MLMALRSPIHSYGVFMPALACYSALSYVALTSGILLLFRTRSSPNLPSVARAASLAGLS
jgi:hypothetical protein